VCTQVEFSWRYVCIFDQSTIIDCERLQTVRPSVTIYVLRCVEDNGDGQREVSKILYISVLILFS
jgi:hypothetical protein